MNLWYHSSFVLGNEFWCYEWMNFFNSNFVWVQFSKFSKWLRGKRYEVKTLRWGIRNNCQSPLFVNFVSYIWPGERLRWRYIWVFFELQYWPKQEKKISFIYWTLKNRKKMRSLTACACVCKNTNRDKIEREYNGKWIE